MGEGGGGGVRVVSGMAKRKIENSFGYKNNIKFVSFGWMYGWMGGGGKDGAV